MAFQKRLIPQSRATPRLLSQERLHWLSRHPFIVLGLVLIVSLGPFVNKGIQTDDALFVWTGQWIQAHPLDFFGGKTNWWASAIPMWMANQNPPLLSYFFAAAASIFGWNEIPLHIVCMGFAFAAAAGIYSLAKMWCGRPLLATVIGIFTPAFLVSSTTLMCDVPMLAFWIWSVVVFERAIEAKSKSPWPFVLAGFLAGLAIVTKYSAVMLLPLLTAIGALRLRKPGWWMIALIVPLIFIASYECYTAKLYGHGLISLARRYAQSDRYGFPGGSIAKGIISFTFAGASLLPVLFLTPWLWRPRTWLIGAIIILGTLIGIFSLYNPGLIHTWEDPAAWNDEGFRLEVALLVAAGMQLILIAAVDLVQRRDNVSTTLFLWIIGVFVFAGVINWTTNVRSFLPACPAVAILVVRRMEMVKADYEFRGVLAAPIALAAAVALSLVIADYQTANLMRSTVEQIAAKYAVQGRNLWIEGHQGFQYYLQKLGGTPVDAEKSLLEPGDVVAVSWNSGNTVSLPPGSVSPIETLAPDPGCWMNLSGGNQYGLAGFYGSDFGPVPFVIGDWRPGFFIANVVSRVQFHTRPANEQEMREGAGPSFPKLDWSVDQDPALPGNPGADKQLRLAAGFEKAGQLSEAAQCYRKALDLDATNVEALNNLGWILATAGNPDLRDTSQAVQLALEAAKLTQGRQPIMIGTLAAAFAEDGDFPKAMATAKIAHDLAQLTGQTGVATRNEELLDLYAHGKTVSSQRNR